ncbi:kinase-like domain-containing protein [Crassisporium funariophilum]|nr:kinase-like domain-containing protein [Crassisporium funariophilum]
MLSFQGNIKIVDFGLSMLSSSTHTPFVPGEKHVPDYGGTFPYMAPETVMSKGWGMEVDWWALGIVVVELESIRVKHCSGFLSKEDYKMWFKCAAQKSVAEKRIFFKEEKLTGDALDLACGLLWPKPANRYGFDTLLHHPYFTTNGVSVFDKLGARSFEREREVYHPAFSGFFPVRRYAPTMVRDIPNSWVNPRGSFYPPGYAHPDYPDY